MYNIILTLILTYFITSVSMGMASARDQIRVVGSSTVYPFATIVAEKFGKSTPFKTPIIEIAKYIIEDFKNILTIEAIIIPIKPIIKKDPNFVKSLLVVYP